MMQFVTKTKPKLSFKLSNKRQSSFSKKPLQICLFAAAATCWLSVFFNIPKIKNCKTRFSGVCQNIWPLLGWLILQFYIHAPAPKESYYNEIIAKPKIHFLCLNPFPLQNIGTALKLGRNMIHVLGGLASLASGAVLYNHSTAIENLKTKVLCLYFLPAIHLTTSSVVAVCWGWCSIEMQMEYDKHCSSRGPHPLLATSQCGDYEVITTLWRVSAAGLMDLCGGGGGN